MSISTQFTLLLENKKNIKEAIENKLGGVNITLKLSIWPSLIMSINTTEEESEEVYDPVLDEYTHIFFMPQNATTVYSFLINPTGETTIDWGDETEPDVLTETGILFVSHTYSTMSGANTVNNGVGAYPYTVKEIKISSNSTYSLEGLGTGNGTNLSATNYRGFNNMASYILEVIPATNCLFGSYCFHSCCNIRNIKLSPIQTTLNYTFPACYGLDNLNLINENITSLGLNTFANCYSLKEINLPSNITSIGNYCFLNSYAIRKAIIPSTVTSVGTYVFNNCTGLEEVYWKSPQLYICNNSFNLCFNLKILDLTQATQIMRFGTSDAAANVGNCTYINVHPSLHIVIPKELFNSWKTSIYWRNFWTYLYWRDDNGVLHNTDPDEYADEPEFIDNSINITGDNVIFNDSSDTTYLLTDDNLINWLNSTINE